MRTVNAFLLAASVLLLVTTIAAPPPGLHAASIQLPGHNSTLPFNAAEARLNRPHDPYAYRARGSHQTIRFSNYGVATPISAIEECFSLAYLDLGARRGKIYEYKDDLEYSALGLVVKMVPSEVMTWFMWEEAIVGILKFSRSAFAGVLRFEIMQDGIEEKVGTGSIQLRSLLVKTLAI